MAYPTLGGAPARALISFHDARNISFPRSAASRALSATLRAISAADPGTPPLVPPLALARIPGTSPGPIALGSNPNPSKLDPAAGENKAEYPPPPPPLDARRAIHVAPATKANIATSATNHEGAERRRSATEPEEDPAAAVSKSSFASSSAPRSLLPASASRSAAFLAAPSGSASSYSYS